MEIYAYKYFIWTVRFHISNLYKILDENIITNYKQQPQELLRDTNNVTEDDVKSNLVHFTLFAFKIKS